MCTSHFQLRDPLFAIHINFTLKCLLCLHWSFHFVVPWSFLKISLCLPSCFHFVLPWSFWKVSLCLPWSFHFVLPWSFLNVSLCLHWSFHLFFFTLKFLENFALFTLKFSLFFLPWSFLKVSLCLSWSFYFVSLEVFTLFCLFVLLQRRWAFCRSADANLRLFVSTSSSICFLFHSFSL